MTNRLATSLIALSTVVAAPAMADVTAADVWSNQRAFYGAMGVTLSGDLSGDVLSNPEMNAILPEGAASFQIVTDSPLKMADNGDGTVSITYPSPMTVSLAGGAPGKGAFTAKLTMTHDGYAILASGDPGDITYEVDAQNVRFDIADVTIDDATVEKFDMSGFLNVAYWAGTSRVTEGDVITYTSDSETGDTDVDFKFEVDNVTSRSTQNTLPIESVIALTLPANGIDLMNMSQATRDGLSLLVESNGEGTNSLSETMLRDELINRQVTQTGPQVLSLSFGEDGLLMEAEAADFNITMNDQMLFPGDLDFGMEKITLAYDLPLNASEDPQNFRVATSMMGVTLGDAIWDMFDPAAMLPRDPAEITFDVTGMGTNGADLLDFISMGQMFGPPPIEVDEVTIENLRISAVGAEATATGAMTFDWTDFQTIPGIARPQGEVTVNLNGANKLMDTLSAMGLVPEEDLMMPRMMMGMFSTPVGDDMLETVLEVNSEGHVLANGQRLQ